jgi:hypothetical protein
MGLCEGVQSIDCTTVVRLHFWKVLVSNLWTHRNIRDPSVSRFLKSKVK